MALEKRVWQADRWCLDFARWVGGAMSRENGRAKEVLGQLARCDILIPNTFFPPRSADENRIMRVPKN